MPFLTENEKKIIEIRKHPFRFYVSVGILFFFYFILLLMFLLIFKHIPSGFILSTSLFFFFVYSLLCSLGWVYVFVFWTDYFIDAWIVTDKRVVDFELNGLFHKDTVSVRLENIQDIKVEVRGLLHHLLGSGDMHIQTAGTNKEFVIHNVKNPPEMKKIIMGAVDRHKKYF